MPAHDVEQYRRAARKQINTIDPENPDLDLRVMVKFEDAASTSLPELVETLRLNEASSDTLEVSTPRTRLDVG